MQQLKSGKLLVLLFLLFCGKAWTQQVINDVSIEKTGTDLYRIQYGLNPSSDFDVEKIVLKIYRRRDGNVQEIFSLPMTTPVLKGQNQQTYSFNWKASNDIVQAGDDLQAKIILSKKASAARQRLNRIPFADAGSFTQVELPVTKPITLNGSKSHDDDGIIAFVEWKQVGGPTDLTIADKNSLVTSADGNFKAGTYAFELTIKDNLGSVSSSRTSLTVKGHSYWTTMKPKNSAPKKNGLFHSTSKTKSQSQLKGGPSNAALNLFLPGVGHYFVSGDSKGQNRKAGSFIITGIYAASLGGAVFLHQQSNKQYEKYNQLASYREYQKDANGNIIGVRGASQEDANQYFNKARSSKRNSLICLGVGGTVLVGDLIYTFLKGSRNKRDWQAESTSFKPNFMISSDGLVTTAGVQFKF